MEHAKPPHPSYAIASIYMSFIFVSLIAMSSYCAEWPQFRGLQRDGSSAETPLAKEWPHDGPPLLWSCEGLGDGFSSAVSDGDTIYVSGLDAERGEGYVTALDRDGKPRWKVPYGKEWTGSHPGTRYPPTIGGGQLFLLSGHGVVYALDTRDGTTLWRRDISADFGGPTPIMGFAESLLVDGDVVYCTPGGRDTSVVALDRHTGETRWASEGHNDPSAYCSPLLVERGGTGLLITLTSATLIAFDPATGAIVWRVPFDETAQDQNHSVAPVYRDGLLYVTSGHRDGGVLFELSPDGREIGERWRDDVLNPLHGGVVLAEGHLYGANSRGRWVCLRLDDGALQWEDRGVGRGSLIQADGRLYCYGEKGTLALVEATPKGYTARGSIRIEAGAGPHWAHPSIADGVLYIRHGGVLLAYHIREGA